MGKIRLVLVSGLVLLGGAIFFFYMKGVLPPSTAQSVHSGDAPVPREQAAVEIYPEKQQLAGIKTVDVAMVSLKKTVRTTGRVEFDERKLTTVNIKVDGWIEKLYADYSGKYVRKGEPLADIFSPELTATQLEYLNLLRWKGQLYKYQRSIEFEWGDRYGTTGKMITYDPDALIEVAKQKFKLWGFTEAQIKEIEEKQEPYRTIIVRSPASGHVYQKPAFRGTRVSPGDKIFDIVDLSTVWVLADLFENEISLVRVGQPAKITVSSVPGVILTSKVDFIYPFLIGQTRTARARFVLPNKDLKLKPQMFTDVEIEVDLGTRLAIPRDAVLETGRRQIVYVDVGDGFFQPRQVRLGSRGDQMVEVLEGLKEKERVAFRAVFLIDSEAKLKGIDRQ